MSKESSSKNYDFLTLDDVETSGKRIFLRVDINVPIDPSTDEILDDTRIRAISDTLKELKMHVSFSDRIRAVQEKMISPL